MACTQALPSIRILVVQVVLVVVAAHFFGFLGAVHLPIGCVLPKNVICLLQVVYCEAGFSNRIIH